MSCCGQGRASLRASEQASRPRQAVTAPAPRHDGPPADGEVTVEYLGDAPVLVRGIATGRAYTFSPGRRLRHVLSADAAHLVLDPIFMQRLG